MRIACPTCAATYDVSASRLLPGKKIRCMRCGGEWLYARPAEAPEPIGRAEPESLPPVTAMDRLAASPAPGAPSSRLAAAWILTVIVLVGAVTATVIWRQAAMRAWPPSALILAPFGQIAFQPAQTAGNGPNEPPRNPAPP
jgi:predicted Zn finger-like uncharacterized protein